LRQKEGELMWKIKGRVKGRIKKEAILYELISDAQMSFILYTSSIKT